MKRTVCHRQAWVGWGRSKREGEKEWDLASHFVDRLNKSIKAQRSTLIELHKWDWEGGTHGKAATKEQQGWADHSFRHFLKLIIHAGPSLLFFYPLICPSVSLCLSVYSTFLPTPPWLALLLCPSFEHCTFHKWDSLPSTICPSLFQCRSFWVSHTFSITSSSKTMYAHILCLQLMSWAIITVKAVLKQRKKIPTFRLVK